jgi:energy-coupling factor transporter ATP-binding protein EcfA2
VVSARPHLRVDGRLLEAALLNLRRRTAAIPLVFAAPGAEAARTERAKLLSQIDDYLLPRLRHSAAPVLVALVGSTGAGKSTLVNSIVGAQVSATGVRRPTTNSPVLACHPDDVDWFAENNFLPTLPRVRQEGLARPGRDGLLVLATSELMSKGIALLDTPDIDSVARAHHEFAYQFLDASDLWLFMTSASRYADGMVWEVLQHARERGASLGLVLSRVPPGARSELVDHFTSMLEANGIKAENRFVIPETLVKDGMLPPEAYQPVRDWLADTAAKEDRRVAVLTQTMSGVLDTFKTRVPELAAHVETQVASRLELRRAAEAAYRGAFGEVEAAASKGALLQGEVLARWQDFAVTGDLMRGLRSRKGAGRGRRGRKGQVPERGKALKAALRSALESFIVSVADRAAEDAAGRWHANPAGAVLLAGAEAAQAADQNVERIFAAAFGPEGGGAGSGADPNRAVRQVSQLSRSSPDLPLHAARAVSAWQDHLMRVARPDSLTKRSLARQVAFDAESLSLVAAIAMLAEGSTHDGAATLAAGSNGDGSNGDGDGSDAAGADILAVPHQLLASLFGEAAPGEITARARADLVERVRLLLDEEMLRFAEVIDSAGNCDDVAGVRLYQAEFSLEAVR